MSKLVDVLKQIEEFMPLQTTSGAKDDGDENADFPYIEDPEAYVTHRPYEDPYGRPFSNEQDLMEQEDEEVPPEAVAGEEGPEGEAPPEGGEEMPPEGEEEPPLDVDQAVGAQKEQLTAKEIGRVFELKKIYSRLAAVEQYLSISIDTNLLELRNRVSQAISLFEIVIDNFDSYKEKVDEIIVTFYKFIKTTYSTLREHYKQEAGRNK